MVIELSESSIWCEIIRTILKSERAARDLKSQN